LKKEDVELVLIKSFEYWKSILCDEIDLGELHELSNFIWDSIQEDQELDSEIKHIYVVTKRSLSKLVTKGEHTFHDVYGNTIVLKFEDEGEPPCLLESGTILLAGENMINREKRNESHPSNVNKPDAKLNESHKKMNDLVQKTSKKGENMKIKIEFDLDDIYVDAFRPIFDQPILKVMYDIRRVQSLIIDKISKDIETSYDFKNISYEDLYKRIDAWATRDHDEEMEYDKSMKKI